MQKREFSKFEQIIIDLSCFFVFCYPRILIILVFLQPPNHFLVQVLQVFSERLFVFLQQQRVRRKLLGFLSPTITYFEPKLFYKLAEMLVTLLILGPIFPIEGGLSKGVHKLVFRFILFQVQVGSDKFFKV